MGIFKELLSLMFANKVGQCDSWFSSLQKCGDVCNTKGSRQGLCGAMQKAQGLHQSGPVLKIVQRQP